MRSAIGGGVVWEECGRHVGLGECGFEDVDIVHRDLGTWGLGDLILLNVYEMILFLLLCIEI